MAIAHNSEGPFASVANVSSVTVVPGLDKMSSLIRDGAPRNHSKGMTESEFPKATAKGLSEVVVLRKPIYPSDQAGFGRTRPWWVVRAE